MKPSHLFRLPFQRNDLQALFSGILLALSFPNPLNVLVSHFHFGLLAWIALVPLLLSLEGKPPLAGFRLGWIAGFAGFTGILYWVVIAMHRYGGIPVPISLLILIALTLYLSLYVGAFAALVAAVRNSTGWSLSITAPPLWVGLEYLRSTLLTGFPWEDLGYSQYLNLPVIQIADITGVFGISFLVVLANSLVSGGIVRFRKTGKIPLGIILILAILAGGILSYGYLRIESETRRTSSQTPIRVGIVQGNIDQSLKWDKAYQRETLRIYQTLTREIAHNHPDLIIWPETAVPFFFPYDQPFTRMVRNVARETGAPLLFGSPFYEVDNQRIRYFNSAYLVSPEGKIGGRYDKIHLVPFGEYVPLARFLPFIEPLVESVGNLVSGSNTLGTVVFSIPRARFGVLICYEIIFPGLTRRFIGRGADFLVTITNDAWFGKTSAPYQHFSMAVFRAVENRTYVARAANTGISGIIDSTGRIILETEIFSRVAVSGEVFLREAKTFYTRYGDLFAHACLGWGLLLLGGAYSARKRKYPGLHPQAG
ncbi:MAG: apolipoprotein N-acyltransferase [Deltaproteobacteria bacterium]|nr:apolipoprotein N-acyltransferase [Deltaproteobacteria bacterium]